MAATLVPAVVRTIRDRYPDIMLHITEVFGGVLSEAVVSGALDIALIYEPGPVRGLRFTTLTEEEMYLVGPAGSLDDLGDLGGEVSLARLADLPLLLPERNHTVRQRLDAEASAVGVELRVISEVVSMPSMIRLVDAGLGWTVMPEAAVHAHFSEERYQSWRVVDPPLRVRFALCSADHAPLSEAAAAVLMALRELFHSLP